MKVMTIFGGPRRRGNTATVLGWVEDELRSQGHDVERVNVIDHKINGCLGCRTCKSFPDEIGCCQRDDAVPILERMLKADAVLLASPLYGWGFTGQMKTLLDRFYSLTTGARGVNYKSLMEGRRGALLITAGGRYDGNADLVVESFRRLLNYTLMQPAGQLIVAGCSTPDKLSPEAKAEALSLARQIAGTAPIAQAAA